MRILHVIPSVAARRGGPTYVVLHLARALARRGVRVDLLATRADLDEAGERQARLVLGADVRLELVSSVGPAQLETAPGLVPALWRRLSSVDLVHVHTAFTFPAAIPPMLCRARDVAHVIRPAGTLDADCIGMRSARRKRLAIAVYCRRNLVGADAVQATSEKEARELRLLAPGARVEVVEVGAESSAQSSDDASRDDASRDDGSRDDGSRDDASRDDGRSGRRVGFLGRLHPTKQLDVLLGAVALLGSDVELVLAGDGEAAHVAGLRERSRALGIEGRVRFVGHLDEPAKRAFFAACDLLAFPSKHESFGVAVAEAMASGRAVVVSPGVALGPIIAAAGAGAVATADAASFARAIGAFLDDGAGRARAAAAGGALATKRWSWDTIAAQTIQLYERILSRRRSR